MSQDSKHQLQSDDAPGLPLNDFGRELFFGIGDLGRLMRAEFARRSKDTGLTEVQWRLMGYLTRFDGQTQTQLAQMMDVEKAALGKLIDRMEEGGWVRRQPDPDDRRVNRVYMTDKVAPYQDGLRAIAGTLYTDALRGISEGDRKTLLKSVLKMRENLQALTGDDKPTGNQS